MTAPNEPHTTPAPLGYAGPSVESGTSQQPTTLVIGLLVAAVTVSLIAAALVLWQASLPMAFGVRMALGELLWVMAGFLWLVPVAVTLFECRRNPRVRRWRWLLGVSLPAILAVLCFVLIRSDAPFRLAYAVNHSTMDRWAKQAIASGMPLPTRVRLGTYEAQQIDAIPGGVRFFVTGSGFFRAAGGFAYSPVQPPPKEFWDSYTPLGGGWYRWQVIKE